MKLEYQSAMQRHMNWQTRGVADCRHIVWPANLMWQVLGGYLRERKSTVGPCWDTFCRGKQIDFLYDIFLEVQNILQAATPSFYWCCLCCSTATVREPEKPACVVFPVAKLWRVCRACYMLHSKFTHSCAFLHQIWPLLRDTAAVAEHHHDRHHAHHAEPVHQRPHDHWTQHQKTLLHRSETLAKGLFTALIKLNCINTAWESMRVCFIEPLPMLCVCVWECVWAAVRESLIKMWLCVRV